MRRADVLKLKMRRTAAVANVTARVCSEEFLLKNCSNDSNDGNERMKECWHSFGGIQCKVKHNLDIVIVICLQIHMNHYKS